MANLYFVLAAGNNNWIDVNIWSTTADGLGVPHAEPGSTDNVYPSASIAAGATLVLDVAANAFCRDMDWTGVTNNPTFNHNGKSIHIYGSLKYAVGMTISGIGNHKFRATNDLSKTVFTAGKTLYSFDFFGADGGWTLLDDVTLTNAFLVEYTNVQTNGKTITCTAFADGGSNSVKVLNLNGGASPSSNSIAGLALDGQIYFASKLANGNYLVAVARGTDAAHTGAMEVNPADNSIIFTWNDPTWNPAGDGPENIYKYSSGNYVIGDCDGGTYIYEMQPDHTKVWTYDAGVGALFRPISVGGIDCILVFRQHPAKTVKIIKRSDQSELWTYAAGSYPNGGDCRVINGVAKVLIADYQDHTLTIVDYVTKNVDWTYATGASAGPYTAQWIDDTHILFSNGIPRVAHIIRPADNFITWTSKTFSGTVGAAELYDSTHAVIVDGSALVYFVDVTQIGSTINCTSWNFTGNNTTMYTGQSVIKVTGTGVFTGAGKTYGEVQLNGASHTVAGSNTFQRLKLASGTTQTITFTDTTTQTIKVPVSGDLSGSAGHVHTLQGSAAGGWALVKTPVARLSFDYLSISRSTVSPTFWYAGPAAHSTDGGNNSGWIFTANPIPKLLAAGVI